LSVAKPSATGRRITAIEALDAYGLDVLAEVQDRGSAILPVSADEPAATLRLRRLALGLSKQEVAKMTRLSIEQIDDCENADTRSPIRDLEQLASALGLDERLVSVIAGANGDQSLAVRLKAMKGVEGSKLSAKMVLVLTEAAWVIRTQQRMRRLLNLEIKLPVKVVPSDNYGDRDYPAWRQGYYLAQTTRQILGVGDCEPIESLREICQKLGIPVLQTAMETRFAGATVSTDEARGIVVNTVGHNQNVWVRRATIAHELGHLLWDPEQRLDQVVVDKYEDLDSLEVHHSAQPKDFVEARANAFAIAFLAPLGAVEDVYAKAGGGVHGLRAVMVTFGISYTAARFHVQNLVSNSASAIEQGLVDTEPTDEWRGREAYTDDFFPLQSTSSLRRGEFSSLVARANLRGLISADTASVYLEASSDQYIRRAELIADLFSFDA
jgi:Zn-dependent peptidase ImmA (M78 family)/transcriptional regulator with XRE-family HTH domain